MTEGERPKAPAIADRPAPSLDEDLQQIYARRFSDADTGRRGRVWRELTRYLQRYVAPDARVLDLACDRGGFINAIRCEDRWAVDVRDIREHLDPEVHFVRSDGLRLRQILDTGTFDLVFMSNYLEHLASADIIVEQLKVAWDLLRPGGRLLVLQPNIRLVGASYWDFLDHKTPLTEKSLEEAARTAGFVTERIITRFIPYTTKSRFPQHALLVRIYLAFPPAWWILGRQTLYVGRRPLQKE